MQDEATRLSATATSLPAEGSSVILPDPKGVLTALARIGYELEVALADLVDNSIDADASAILIRFFRTNDRLVSIAVVDDGLGMTEARLDQAMGFGADMGKGFEHLGKYGMGLKSASFSQCKSVTVVTKRGRSVVARRWTADNIKRGWVCDHIDRTAAGLHLQQNWGELSVDRSGTLVHWDGLDAFRVAGDRADGVLEEYFRRIQTHLGLHFHRFVEEGRVSILLDAVNEETGEYGPAREIEPLDPFGYPTTGRRGYPRTFTLHIGGVGKLDAIAHIWPRRSRTQEYTLGGGKVAQRQGFYFYRNDRLIQGGGWNGWRDDAEPHSSLARVQVDLPGEYDQAFGLNVQKSAVSVPAGFLEALETASSGPVTFRQYVLDAIETYRTKTSAVDTEPPLVPGRGVGSALARQLRRHVVGRSRRETRGVEFVWKAMPADRFFEVDRNRDIIYLNRAYRAAVLHGLRGSAADAPLIKTLLFLLLEDDLDRQRDSGLSREWLSRCQAMLVAAARSQMP
jgi:hypothetical protein